MTTAPASAAERKTRSRSAPLPANIPLPPLEDEHFLRREAFLLLFCAAFAAAIFFLWTSVEASLLEGWSPEMRRPIERIKDILVPFVTAYVAARLYSSMVRHYERQLHRSQHLLAHISDQSADGIVTLDAEDRISTWNKGAEQIFGHRESAMLGQHASVLFPDGGRAEDELSELRRAVGQEGTLRNHYGERLTKNNKRITVEVSTVVLRDTRGRYAGRASIFRDVTERTRIRDELARRESLAAIGEMAAAVAHEIKNPLAGIGGAVKVISKAFAPEDPRAEVVDEIQNQVRRLDETIRDLLTFARPTVPRHTTLELRQFSERILRVLGAMPDLQRHAIEVDVPADLTVRADPQLLENILANLLSNAGQAIGGRPGRIVLRASETEDETRVEISDDGAGIPDDVLAKLFKPFFTTRAKGTGLGLTIVHKFVEVMGGRIDVETSEGKGTTFTVVLPREMEAA